MTPDAEELVLLHLRAHPAAFPCRYSSRHTFPAGVAEALGMTRAEARLLLEALEAKGQVEGRSSRSTADGLAGTSYGLTPAGLERCREADLRREAERIEAYRAWLGEGGAA